MFLTKRYILSTANWIRRQNKLVLTWVVASVIWSFFIGYDARLIQNTKTYLELKNTTIEFTESEVFGRKPSPKEELFIKNRTSLIWSKDAAYGNIKSATAGILIPPIVLLILGVSAFQLRKRREFVLLSLRNVKNYALNNYLVFTLILIFFGTYFLVDSYSPAYSGDRSGRSGPQLNAALAGLGVSFLAAAGMLYKAGSKNNH